MKKHLSSILIIGLFLVGGALMLYPFVGNLIQQRRAAHMITTYTDAVSDTSKEDIEKMFLQAEGYNRKLLGGQDPSFDVSTDDYTSILDPTGTGVIGYICIDRIGVELPIYHGTSKSVLQVGAGHIEGTSLPIGGESTHSVLSGHRGLPSAKLFTDLDKLDVGDQFTITCLDRTLTYRIDQIKTVLPSETSDLLITKGQDYCTLVTCTPYGINSHRLLLRGVRVPDMPASESSALEPVSSQEKNPPKVDRGIPVDKILAAGGILVILVSGVVIVRAAAAGKKRKENKDKSEVAK